MELQIVIEPKEKYIDKGCCIYNVPEKLREVNKEAYTPQVVSIGPLHRDRPHLQAMRLTKKRFCKRFCKRTQSNMDRYRKEAKGWEEEARACYEGIVKMDSEEFVEMILMDGIFVVEVLLWMSNITQNEPAENDEDEIFRNTLLNNDVLHDMMMLENQLPLFIIEKLYNFLNNQTCEWKDVLFIFADKYFKKTTSTIRTDWVTKALSKGRHLIDFYHIISVYANPCVEVTDSDVLKRERYKDKNSEQIFKLSHRAKELKEAGVVFKPRKYMLPFDLDFDIKEGIMDIPVVTINRWTEAFFINLIAYEHCLRKEKIITSFVVLMAKLLEKPEDVEILIELKVIHNQTLGKSEDVCALFQSLYKESMMNTTEFFYVDLCKDLNEYSRDYWHQWKATWYKWKEMLKNDYFKSPWSTISVIAATILLVLTVIQTIYTIKGIKK